MSNKKFEDFYTFYTAVEKEEDLLPLLKDFMFSCSFDELMAWNQYLSKQSALFWESVEKQGLADDHKERLIAIHNKYDDLYRHFTNERGTRKAA
jgi:hypothetical protein